MRTYGIACRGLVVVLMAVGVTRAGDTPIVDGVPPGYEVIVVDDTPGFYQRPGISNDGQVVYSRTPAAGEAGVIYRYTRDGGIEALTDGTMNDHWPDISPDGTKIVWKSGPGSSPPWHLVLYEDGVMQAFPQFPSVKGIPTVNDTGLVLWTHDTSDVDPIDDLILYDGENVATVVSNGLSNQSPRLNCRGDFAWTRYNFFESPWTSVMMARLGGVTAELTDGTGTPQLAGLNDLQTVVWGQWNGTFEEVGRWEEGVATVLAEGFNPRVNNDGNVCFGRWKAELERYVPMLLHVGTVYRLPDFDYSSAGCAINIRGEASWRGHRSTVVDAAILVMRAIQHHGDFDQDCAITVNDVGAFLDCLTGPTGTAGDLPAACLPSDFDNDGDADFADFGLLQLAYTGVEGSIPACVPLAADAAECPEVEVP